MKIKLLGIDLAKNVFQLCALNQANKVLFNRSIRRARFRSTIAKLELTTITMEACSSAHYWGRVFEAMGHQVLLVPAQHVTPFVRGGKSDARDALAICEAAHRPELHPVPIKSIEQQDIQLLHRGHRQWPTVQVRTTSQRLARTGAAPIWYRRQNTTQEYEQEW